MAYLFIAKILPLCLVLSLFLFALRKISTSASDFLADRMGLHFWATAALCMMMVYAAALAFRLYLPATLDFVEATVASTSSLFLHGHPLYAGLQDADRYSLMYGPLCFLPYSIFFMFGAGSIGTLLVALAFWNVALFASLWLLYRTFLSKAESLVAVAAIASALMMKSSYIFMIRGDVILACCVALSLLACSRFNRMAAVCLFSVAGACAIDVKITAVFYLLVPAYFLVRRHGVRAMAACMAFIPCVALLPCMLPGISLRHYALWLYEASRHPLSRTVLIMNLLPALLVTLGPLLMYWRLALADQLLVSALNEGS